MPRGTISASFRVIKGSVKNYSEEPSSWSVEDTNHALQCWDFEKFLGIGVVLFEGITEAEEEYRLRVLRGDEEWDQGVQDVISEALKLWLVPCDTLLKDLEHFEKHFGQIKNAETFRLYVREAKAILMPDAEFFADEALAEARDAAIDQHRNGECLEYRPRQQECEDGGL